MRRMLVALTLACSACASVRPERGHDKVDELVTERLGLSTGWGEGKPGEEAIAVRVDDLLGQGLTRERAMQIALLNNPEIQATYAGLGVSQAAMVQAGLLSNPVLSGSVGFPISSGEDRVEYEASLVQSFLDVFVLPLRKRVAGEQFIADTLQVAHQTLAMAAEASHVFIRYQAAARVTELQKVLMQAAMAGAADAEARFRAGNTTQLELDVERAAYEESRQDYAQREIERIGAREDLNRILGLWGPRTNWTLAEPLQEMPPEDPPLERLESLAIRRRLDIDAARKQALLMHNAVSLASSTRFFGLVEVGVHVHQDPDGPRLFGPTLSLELPFFDQRQATIARLESQRSQAERRLDALSVAARAAVRATAARLQGIRGRLEHQRGVLLPLRERIVDRTQRQYNAMQIGLSPLLDARREQAMAYLSYLETLRDYWIARADLEQLVGGSLRPAPPPLDEKARQ